MYYAGLDVASKGSFLYVQDRLGHKVEGREIPTTKWSIQEVFKKYKSSLIEVAIEAGGQTRWIYDTLKAMGIRVYVVNPNKVKAIAESKRKTDKIDAKLLSDLLRLGALPQEVIMAEGEARQLRDLIQARQKVIDGYTSLMNYLRGLLRQEGILLPSRAFNNPETFLKLLKSHLPEHVRQIITHYHELFGKMIAEKKNLEQKILRYDNEDIAIMKTLPGIGEMSSRTIDAAIGYIKRFERAKKLTSYSGLVPAVRSSGERTEYGHITREGRSEIRRVAIQCAHALLRSKSQESLPLRQWYERIATRRGCRTAVVALARKMLTIMFYMLRDKKAYDYKLLTVN
jgi:transposase